MKKIISLITIIGFWGCSIASYAIELPALPAQQAGNHSPFKFFISSEPDTQTFDSWKVDSGYSYAVFDNLNVYVGARVDNASNINQSGFLSGVSYQISPRFSVKSTLHAYSYTGQETREESKDAAISAEVSSRMKLTENLDVHATVDYQQWQQGVEFGLGFRF
ncbi:hypothetical protein M1D72_18855 [Vibrio sp. AK197]